ncbi:MAG: sulfatase-like hydrolase/transferase [Planctomycetota bacterium]
MRRGITRRELIKGGGVGLCALALGARLAAAQEKKRPNVLILTTDQQRVDAMSAVGNQWVKTPHMDSIAASGVYFTRSYCPYPLCSPSRSSLHTGRTPHEIGVDCNSVPIDPAIPISGQVFHGAGYDTGYAGKWHMPDAYPLDGIAGYEVLNKIERKGKVAHEVDEATMTGAIEFLKRRHDKPFLLVASFINPHDICLLAGEDSPLLEDVWKMYQPVADAELPPLPSNFTKAEGPPGADKRTKHEKWDENHWRRYRYAYYRMVEDVDRQVGQVLEALRQTGQEENTLVIFTSDHGEGLGSDHWTGKMMFYDDEAAVPLIVSWKGTTPAGRIDREHLVSALDVLPTICDYAGVQPPPSMRGESLRAVIEKPDQPGHEFVASEMAGHLGGSGRSFMVRTKKYKYMVFPSAEGERFEMLFDMDSDAGEMKNLAGDAALAGELERHRQLLAQWKKTTEEDKYPIKAKKAKAGNRRGKRKQKQQQ